MAMSSPITISARIRDGSGTYAALDDVGSVASKNEGVKTRPISEQKIPSFTDC